MGQQFIDDNGVTAFVDDNGVTRWVDDAGNILGSLGTVFLRLLLWH
jgi:hypothetical protein